jgi:isopenicillin N synthase-like dioxygenase
MNATAPRLAGLDEVPIIDAGPLLAGTAAGLSLVGAQIREACERIGFFYVVNHGVPQATIDGAFAAARQFFGQPIEDRLRVRVNPWHRGYMPPKETTLPGFKPNLLDSFDLAMDLAPDDPDVLAGKPLHGVNQWPDSLPGFRAAVERYYAEVPAFGFQLLRGFAAALDLPEATFQDIYRQRPLVSMRLLHYPPVEQVTEGEYGSATHTDYGIITILMQDDVGGLELRTRSGEWISAPTVPGAFIINIADLMAIWTNDRFVSMPHRVLNRSRRARFSIPIFYNPNYDTVVSCLPSCQSADNPPRHAPQVLGDYLVGKFNKAYAYRRAAASAAAE